MHGDKNTVGGHNVTVKQCDVHRRGHLSCRCVCAQGSRHSRSSGDWERNWAALRM